MLVILNFFLADPYRPTRQGVPAHIARGALAASGTRVFYRGGTGRSNFIKSGLHPGEKSKTLSDL